MYVCVYFFIIFKGTRLLFCKNVVVHVCHCFFSILDFIPKCTKKLVNPPNFEKTGEIQLYNF